MNPLLSSLLLHLCRWHWSQLFFFIRPPNLRRRRRREKVKRGCTVYKICIMQCKIYRSIRRSCKTEVPGLYSHLYSMENFPWKIHGRFFIEFYVGKSMKTRWRPVAFHDNSMKYSTWISTENLSSKFRAIFREDFPRKLFTKFLRV